MEKVDDIEGVVDEDLPCDVITIDGVEVIGVQSLQKYLACVACNAKVELTDEKMGICSKCDMVQPSSRCTPKLSARLYIKHGEEYMNLSAFDKVLETIAGSSDVTATTLLEARPFSATYENNIILSVNSSK